MSKNRRAIHAALALGLVALVSLSGCATVSQFAGNPDALAAATLAGPSQVEPLQMRLLPDFAFERITLHRVVTTEGQPGEEPTVTVAKDANLGLYFGNGLYLDAAGNLSIRVDLLAGIDPTFVGTTRFTYPDTAPFASPKKPATATSVYSPTSISIVDPKIPFTGKDSVTINGREITHNKLGYVLQEDGSVLPVPRPRADKWERLGNGYRQTVFASHLLIIEQWTPVCYTQDGNKIVDDNGAFTIVNDGTSLRFAFNDKTKPSFRVYRTASELLVVREADGRTCHIKLGNGTYTWQLPGGGNWAEGKPTVNCSFTVEKE
jgi:hypothetical protein